MAKVLDYVIEASSNSSRVIKFNFRRIPLVWNSLIAELKVEFYPCYFSIRIALALDDSQSSDVIKQRP